MRPVTPSIALVGVGGFGHVHAENIFRLSGLGRVRLAALVSPEGLEGLRGAVTPEVLAWAQSVPMYASLDDYLAKSDLATVIVVCSPIDTHADLAVKAMEAGSHVLLEKPPTTGLAEFAALRATAAATGRVVQVGFQSLGSAALAHLCGLLASGAVGELRSVAAVGTWARPLSYWTRSYWAGKREIDGRPVVDGVVTNALAHAVATALKLAGAARLAAVGRVTLDQYHANAIECDDTSAVMVSTASGVTVSLGLTLAAAVDSDPRVMVRGSSGSATLHYTTDVLDLDLAGRQTSRHFSRIDLTENLLNHLGDPAVPLLCPLEETGGFMKVLDAVRTAPDPRPIPAEFVDRIYRDGAVWTVIDQVAAWCERVAAEQATFAELGAPWAS